MKPYLLRNKKERLFIIKNHLSGFLFLIEALATLVAASPATVCGGNLFLSASPATVKNIIFAV